jgi:hypothetical protein
MNNDEMPNKPFCAGKSIGSCGGAGMCPGIALMISFGLFVGIMELANNSAIAWVGSVGLFAVLVTGIWRRALPKPDFK